MTGAMRNKSNIPERKRNIIRVMLCFMIAKINKKLNLSYLCRMITYEEALQIGVSHTYITEYEQIAIELASGRVLAQEVVSGVDMPPFDKSAMDGYALSYDSLDGAFSTGLCVVEVIPAGKIPEKHLSCGECSKIMTGAPLPEGADMVVMVEDCRQERGKMFIDTLYRRVLHKGDNVCYCGEDVKAGEVLLNKGTLLKPQDVAIIAACGYRYVQVYKKISVGILSTGSELCEPGERSGKERECGKIFNSNSWHLSSMLSCMGAEIRYYGIAPDTEDDTLRLLSEAVSENQVVLLSGGVSEGDFDFVPVIMKKLGFEILFDRVAVQPGKPTTFSIRGDKYIFGLPGNPVSAFVQTFLLVRPLLLSLQGGLYSERTVSLPISSSFVRKNARRLAHIPVRLSPDGTFSPIEYHGSAHISALHSADALARIPIGVTEIRKGERVELILL